MSEYEDFFEEIRKFKEKQDKQKQRGLNDYNILTTVLEPHDEVRLHSRMIGSLLNPDGLHYQNTLFLEKFLDELALDNFEMDLNNIYVGVEYKNIDLYITDGNKHIIIENKIWAEDQPCQIIKYINIIKEEYKLDVDDDDKINDMRVIYLTPQKKNIPDNHILKDDYISFDNSKVNKLENCSKQINASGTIDFNLKNYLVKYHKIDYINIFNWLEKCQYEIQNITNLNEAIRQYIGVVKMIIGKEETMVDLLEDELLKDENKLELAKEISQAYEKAIKKRNNDIRGLFVDKLFNELEELNLGIHPPIHDNKNEWHCLDIKEKYFIRIFRNEDGVTIQITDINNPFSIVSKVEKKLILNKLRLINESFKSGWNKVYATLVIDNNDVEKFNFFKLISDIVK